MDAQILTVTWTPRCECCSCRPKHCYWTAIRALDKNDDRSFFTDRVVNQWYIAANQHKFVYIPISSFATVLLYVDIKYSIFEKRSSHFTSIERTLISPTDHFSNSMQLQSQFLHIISFKLVYIPISSFTTELLYVNINYRVFPRLKKSLYLNRRNSHISYWSF